VVADVPGVKGFCRSPTLCFQHKITKVSGKRGICEKQEGQNALKCGYRLAIRTLLPHLSGRLRQDQGKLAKRLSFLNSSHTPGFLAIKFLLLIPKFFTEVILFFKTFSRKVSQLQGGISGLKQKELFIVTPSHRQTRAPSDPQLEDELTSIILETGALTTTD